MKSTSIIILLLTFLLPLQNYGSIGRYEVKLTWKGIDKATISDSETLHLLRFEGSLNEPQHNFLPYFYENFQLPEGHSDFVAGLKNMIFEPLTTEEINLVLSTTEIANEIQLESTTTFQRKIPFATITFLPIRKNDITGQLEKLVRFHLEIISSPNQKSSNGIFSKTYKPHSVLQSGTWFKLAVTNTGVHKISYQELADMGINVSNLDPKNLRIYGSGGGMLPENIERPRYDDLFENAIYVKGEADGTFNSDDYILFYGEGPEVWEYSYDKRVLDKIVNYYSNYTYYFLTPDLGPGKRISTEGSSNETPNNIVTEFQDALHYELEETNLLNSGRIWYGETFDLFNNLEKEFTIPNLILDKTIIFTAEAAAHSDVTSLFTFYINNVNRLTLPIQNINSNSPNGNFAYTNYDTARFKANSETLKVKVTYSKPLSSSVGYLDYFTMNYHRSMAFTGPQMHFRNLATAENVLVSKYTLSKSNENVRIWDISHPEVPIEINATLTGTKLEFVRASDSLMTFISFDGTGFNAVAFAGTINNQDLHALAPYEMIILTHPDFKSEAQRLADFHTEFDGLSVFVVEPQTIYNEFSSGAQDITAIRDFLKMLYDIAEPGEEPKYLLLFGDGSFDYKDRIENNTNFIPSWESYNSINPVNSYVKDDYYGLLDNATDNKVDIGIGRFVVSNTQQAKTAVDKAIHYASNSPAVMGDWRNIICLMADDEDNNLHFHDAEELAAIIDTMDHNINIDKIYLDAYQQISTPSGERYPEATLDLTNRVERGALIVNYVGHGGEGGLAHERVLKVSDIQAWENFDNMPVFITATCEFSRFDDPERTSAGELIFLNENGGGISLFSTTRATYAGANAALNKSFYRYALIQENGKHARMGDVIRLAKNSSGSIENTAKFMLLGDPALHFAFPKHNVIETKITNIQFNEISDTIKALSEVKITGEMQDYLGNKLESFNGVLFPVVFDKPAKYTTLANDQASIPASFYIQKNILYRGKASINSGEWEFTFIAPKDIAYNYGFGKLSFYAHDNTIDAAGYFDEVVIGGYNEFAGQDNTGPEISLYINDVNFKSGGLTDENPNLFAMIFDESGINTVGSGIGHDIMATLDDSQSFILNTYYESELDNYRKGSIDYPFYNLANGTHKLSLKVWDIYNNSSDASIDFIVAESTEMAVESLLNYPNPFFDYTTFSFEHNQVEQPLDITIQIFSMQGKLVKTITDINYAGGYKYISGKWNGTSDGGSSLQNGLYVYKVLVRNYDGTVAEETSKLVMLK
ncbi:MAG: type IX secretion system sortase PorU [Bacteroidales bacterium]